MGIQERCEADALAAYGDWDRPSHKFITDKARRQLARRVAARLPPDALCQETTDLNYDVCVTLAVRRGANSAELLFSLVGPYFTLLDSDASSAGTIEVVGAQDRRWADLIDSLTRDGLCFLETADLERPVRLKLALCGERGCTVFNALFRDQSSNQMS